MRQADPTKFYIGRLRAGMTKATASKRSGVDRSTIHRIEVGATVRPSADTVAALAEVYEVDPLWFYGIEDPDAVGEAV